MRLGAARGGAEADEAPDQIGGVGPVRVRRLHDTDGVVLHVPRDRHLAHERLHREDVVPVAGRPCAPPWAPPVVRSRMSCSSPRFGEGDVELEEEAVELGLGERVGPLHLERVLRREDDERLVEREGLAAHRDAVLLHRLEQRALRLGRGAVDLVGQDDVGEDGPLRNSNTLPPPCVSSMTVVPMMSAGIRSGVNWMRENGEAERVSDRTRTSIVLPRPGTPSSSACPPASRQVRTPSTTSRLPTIDQPNLLAQRADVFLELLDLGADGGGGGGFGGDGGHGGRVPRKSALLTSARAA